VREEASIAGALPPAWSAKEKRLAGSLVLESCFRRDLTPAVKTLSSLVVALFLGACAGPPETLVVKQFHVRDQVRNSNDEPMVRMEKARRLHGAVSMAERRQRLGQYYTLLWHDPAGAGHGPVEVVFQYQQGATASRIKHMTRQFPASSGEGVAEFAVIGDQYFKGGRVLAWKATLRRGGRELATRQSYLWQ
jgi:hypothetical protein